jgi:hypothetical protein
MSGQSFTRTIRRAPPRLSGAYNPALPAQTLQFTGSLTDIAQTSVFAFSVLAGAGAPTITGGWSVINTVNRSQRLGYTIPQGYNPMTMDIPIQFEALVAQPSGKYMVTPNVEADIQVLHWMAGRGKLYASAAANGVGAPATGDPPIVNVGSYDGNGNETNLIPLDAQGVDWLISAIAYDTSPILSTAGSRIRQMATVSVIQYVGAPSTTADSPTTRAKARNSGTAGYAWRTSTDAQNTIAKLTEKWAGASSTSAFQTVLAANPQLKITSWSKALPKGKRVKIPNSIVLSR